MTASLRPGEGPEPAADPRLRPAVVDDLDFLLAQHLRHFPENVMGRLGIGFLRVYYRGFLTSPHALALVAEGPDGRCGFLVGVLDAARHRAELKRHHLIALAGQTLRAALTRPGLVLGIARRRLRRRPRRDEAPTPSWGTVSVLSHVAVLESGRGHGVASALVAEFLLAARGAGSGLACVATADEAPAARRLYLNHGWQQTDRTQTFDGRWIRLYELVL